MKYLDRWVGLVLLFVVVIALTACPKTPQEKQAFKDQAVAKVDTLNNSIHSIFQTIEALKDANRLSDAKAREYVEILLTVNEQTKVLGDRVAAIDPNKSIDQNLRDDLKAILDGIKASIERIHGEGLASELINLASQSLDVIIQLQKLIKG